MSALNYSIYENFNRTFFFRRDSALIKLSNSIFNYSNSFDLARESLHSEVIARQRQLDSQYNCVSICTREKEKKLVCIISKLKWVRLKHFFLHFLSHSLQHAASELTSMCLCAQTDYPSSPVCERDTYSRAQRDSLTSLLLDASFEYPADKLNATQRENFQCQFSNCKRDLSSLIVDNRRS